MRISDWSSDVCSSDLHALCKDARPVGRVQPAGEIRLEIAVGIAALDPPYRMQIDRDPIMRDRAPGAVQLLMPVVDRGDRKRVVLGKECVSTCRSRWSPYN